MYKGIFVFKRNREREKEKQIEGEREEGREDEKGSGGKTYRRYLSRGALSLGGCLLYFERLPLLRAITKRGRGVTIKE